MSQDEFVAYIRRSVVHSNIYWLYIYLVIVFFYYHGFFVIGKAVVSQEVLHHTGVLPGVLPSLLNELLAIRFPLNGAKKNYVVVN